MVNFTSTAIRHEIIRAAVKCPFTRPIIHALVIRKHVGINESVVKEPTGKTPWVFEEQFDLDGRVAYVERVFAEYFQEPGLPPDCIKGARILEVGPGETLGVALKFVSAGAAQVVCVDRFDSLIDDRLQWQIYERLLSRMAPEERSRVEGAVRIESGKVVFDGERIRYVNRSVETLGEEFPAGSFDVVASRAVLEHVWRIDEAMATLHDMLRPGGFAAHEVDFRDHGIFTDYGFHPLTMFLVDASTWDRMSSNVGAPNRRMASYFRDQFLRRGYSLEEVVTRLFGEDEQFHRGVAVPADDPRSPLSKWISAHSDRMAVAWRDSDLKVAASFFIARKPAS